MFMIQEHTKPALQSVPFKRACRLWDGGRNKGWGLRVWSGGLSVCVGGWG